MTVHREAAIEQHFTLSALLEYFTMRTPRTHRLLQQALLHGIHCELCQEQAQRWLIRLGQRSPRKGQEQNMRAILRKLRHFVMRLQVREQFPQYLELYLRVGEAQANRHYVFLAHHLKQCEDCQWARSLNIEFLQSLEANGEISALASTTASRQPRGASDETAEQRTVSPNHGMRAT